MDDEERIRLDYEQTSDLLRTLTDIRFKLLALVPTTAGATVGLLGAGAPPSSLLGVGLVGLTATVGVFLYELRNTQIYEGVVHRAKYLERRLGLESSDANRPDEHGLFGERPARTLRALGALQVWHDRALGLVYGAALGGWTYLVVWGFLALVGAPAPKGVGAVAGIAAGLLVIGEVERVGEREDKPRMPDEVRPVRAP